jgi:hypothetical protein
MVSYRVVGPRKKGSFSVNQKAFKIYGCEQWQMYKISVILLYKRKKYQAQRRQNIMCTNLSLFHVVNLLYLTKVA